MKNPTMKVLVVEPGKAPEVREIGSELEAMQKVVGGYIEAAYPFQDAVAVIVNEEGKINRLPMNRALRDNSGKVYDVVYGTFFVAAVGEEDFESLSED